MDSFMITSIKKIKSFDGYKRNKVPKWFWLILIWMLLPWWLVIGSVILGQDIYSNLYPDFLILILSVFFCIPILLITFLHILGIRTPKLIEPVAVMVWSGSLCNTILIIVEVIGRDLECMNCFYLVTILNIITQISITFSQCLQHAFFSKN